MPDTLDSEFLALQEALVGRYSLVREIGRGGMGIVYLAHEVALDRPIALKLLPPEMAARPGLRERFLREARMAAKLSHPNIVPVHAVDEVDDFVFFIMMFVEGETLGERIRERGPLPASGATRILREVAWALAYAHGQGVVHRDVKPDNILIEAGSGRALVTDFGIAHMASESGMTDVGEILGTAEFMSPEQASGGAVDERSDLYSLGIVGHYMLSGRLPFEGRTVAATLAKQLTQPAPRLSSVSPEVPSDLAQAMDRCLLKDPAERFANGEELAEALGRALEVRQEVPVPIRRFAEQNQKSSTAIAMIGLGAAWLMMINIVAVIVGGGWGFTATAFLTVVAVALAATPPLILTLTARRLLGSGYGYDDLIRALLADMELRREELASQHGPPTWIDRWARKLTYGGAAVFLGAVGLIPFVPERMMELIALPMLGGAMTLIGAGLVGGLRHQIRTALPGERWFKFWKSRVGRWLFKLAGVRLGRVPAGGAPYRPTEMAIGMAADRLFEELPNSTQQELLGLPEMIQKLEGDAREMRRQVHELNGILAEIGDDPGRVGNEDRAGLRADLEATREVAERRMTEAVSALEKIRLGLLRLHGGAGSVESLTADLSSAQALSDDIDYLVAGKRNVDELLGIPRPSDELETPTPV